MEINEVWIKLLEELKSNPSVNGSQVDAFFSRVKIQAVSNGFIVMTSQEPFIKNWVETHYKGDIEAALTSLYGGKWFVQIELDTTQQPNEEVSKTTGEQKISVTVKDKSEDKQIHAESSTEKALTGKDSAVEVTQPSGATVKSRDITKQPNTPHSAEGTPSLTFESFVMGDSNRMAYSMAIEVADKPGKSALNPLFIYGRSGVGKTHLLCAIKHYIETQYPSMKVRYLDSIQMVNEYSNAAMNKDFNGFDEAFRELDVILIDDIQGLQGKQGTLNTLFTLFNDLIPKGKQFVFSADRAPKNIDLDERYVSRFNSGATIDIQPPDTETKRNIIKSFVNECQKQEDFEIRLPDDVLDFIAENSSSNVRELKSAVTNVVFTMKIDPNHEISRAQVRSLLSNHFTNENSGHITMDQIQQAVADFYGISYEDMVGPRRDKNIKNPRQVAIWLCRSIVGSTFKEIGKAFNRNHSTIVHSHDLIETRLKEDRELHEEIEAIKEKIRTQQY